MPAVLDHLQSIPRPLTLAEIAASRPGSRGAARLSPATLTRWITDGCRDRSGQRIRLVAERCGSRWLVYQAALDEFFTALAADPAPAAPIAMPRTASERSKASAAAGRKLASMGC